MHVPGHNPFIEEFLGFNYSQPYLAVSSAYDEAIPESAFLEGIFENFYDSVA